MYKYKSSQRYLNFRDINVLEGEVSKQNRWAENISGDLSAWKIENTPPKTATQNATKIINKVLSIWI